MHYLRALIVAVLFLIVILLLFMFQTYDATEEVNRAVDSFLKGEYTEAQKHLAKGSEALLKPQQKLYEAYIQRALNNIESSDHSLQEAEELIKLRPSTDLNLEIQLNVALNAYLQNQKGRLHEKILELQKTDSRNAWVTFMSGLDAYENGKFSEAFQYWTPHQEIPVTMSAWMKKSFLDLFTPQWLLFHIARVQIETGDYVSARQTLTDESAKTTNANFQSDIQFLLGLSYFKEAQSKGPIASIPYYKLAYSYFKRVPMSEPQYRNEKEIINAKIFELISNLIQSQNFSDLPFLVNILENWNSKAEIQQLTTNLLNQINVQIEDVQTENVLNLITILNRILPPGQTRDLLGKRLEELLKSQLHQGKIKSLDELWDISQPLIANPEEFSKEFNAELSREMKNQLFEDDPSLKKTEEYLKLWKKLEKNPQNQKALINDLLKYAEILLKDEPKSPHIIPALLFTIRLPNTENLKPVENEIDAIFQRQFSLALKKEDPIRLQAVYLASMQLGLQSHLQVDPSILDKHLTKAKESFQKNDFDTAYAWAQWIILVQPKNQEALKIVADIDYKNGRYPNVVKNLSLLTQSTNELKEMSAVAKTLGGQEQVGLEELERLEKQNFLTDDGLMHLGFSYLLQKQPEKAKTWFEKIHDKNSEVFAGLATIAYQQGNWEEALQLLDKTLPPVSTLDGIKGLRIQTLLNNNQKSKASTLLNDLLESPEQTQETGFSPPFQFFKERYLDTLNRYYLAGVYYKKYDKDLSRSLDYFSKIKDPTPQAWLEKGELYLLMGKWEEAQKSLLVAVKPGNPAEIRGEALGFLGKVSLSLYDYYEACAWFTEFFQMNPLTLNFRREFAEALQQVNRFNASLQQMRMVLIKDPLTAEIAAALLKNLIHVRNFNEAEDLVNYLLSPNASLTLRDKLALGPYLQILGLNQENNTILETAFKDVPALSDEETRLLTQNLFLLGIYPKATEIISKFPDRFAHTVQGLLIQANLLRNLNKVEEALEKANEAYDINPRDPEVITFLRTNEIDLRNLLNKLKNLQKYVLNPQILHPSRVMEYLGFSIRVLDLLNNAGSANSETFAQLSTQALNLNSGMQGIFSIYPVPFGFNGRINLILNKIPQALENFNRSLNLDFSNSEFLTYASFAYWQIKDFTRAYLFAFDAVIFAPNNIAAWQMLAQANISLQHWEDAIFDLTQAFKYAPNDISTYIALAQTYLTVESPEGAKEILEKAIKIDPNNKITLAYLLKSLYDPSLSHTTKIKELQHAREEVFYKLYELDPDFAEKLQKDLKRAERSE